MTVVGAITVSQFAEGRLPNAAELAAVPRPVFLSAGFNGPSQTNEAGRAYFEDRGIAVNADGSPAASLRRPEKRGASAPVPKTAV